MGCVAHPVEVDGHPGEEHKIALQCHATHRRGDGLANHPREWIHVRMNDEKGDNYNNEK